MKKNKLKLLKEKRIIERKLKLLRENENTFFNEIDKDVMSLDVTSESFYEDRRILDKYKNTNELSEHIFLSFLVKILELGLAGHTTKFEYYIDFICSGSNKFEKEIHEYIVLRLLRIISNDFKNKNKYKLHFELLEIVFKYWF